MDGFIVKTEIEDGIHHAGHGERGSGSHGHQQGVIGITQALAHALFEIARSRIYLVKHALLPFVAAVRISHACFASDGKARRNGQTQARHLGKISPLTPKDKVHAGIALCNVDAIRCRTKSVHALFRFHTNPLLKLQRGSDANKPPRRMGTRRISCMIGRNA